MEKGMPAYESGKLQIGDAILSVNSESLVGKTHNDAVKLLKSGSSEIRLSVAYVVGVTAQPEGKDNEDETKLNKPPVVASISKSSSLELKSILDSKVRVASHSTPHSSEVPSQVDEENSRPASAVSPYERLASSFSLHPTPLPAHSKTDTAVADMGLFRYDEVEEISPLSTPTGNPSQTSHFSPVTHQRPLSANDGAELDKSHDARLLDPPSRTSTLEHSATVATRAQVESCSITDSNGHKTAYTPTSMSLPQPSLHSSQHNTRTLPSDCVSKDTATETKYSGAQSKVAPAVQSPYRVRIAAFNIQGASNDEEVPLFCGSIDV